jgi:hypothetical protein
MMYRSGWGTKEGQEVTLGLRTRREFFDSLLSQAVPSTWDQESYLTHQEWKVAVSRSQVRLQWDPDHHPAGAKWERRALQLGLRGPILEQFGKHEVLGVLDLSDFVETQRVKLKQAGIAAVESPVERVYRVASDDIRRRVGIDG